MLDLSVAREKIDKIDEQIVNLFKERMLCANEVAEYKRATGKAVFDKKREDEKIGKLTQMTEDQFNKKAIEELFMQIMTISRKYQYSVLPKSNTHNGFEMVDKLPASDNMKVCFFGLPGTHTQAAMEEFFGEDVEGISCATFREVMERVEKGEAKYGVLPIENSSTGGITTNYDIILEYENNIVGQYVKKIDHSLLVAKGTKEEEITKIYSHPQGLLQSSNYLNDHPEIETIEVASTAMAAKRVAEESKTNKGVAAIAAKRAAKEYGLEAIIEGIQNEKNNSTRFIIICKDKIFAKKSNRIAMCMELPHECGSLYRILSHFLFNDINMTLIESRPIPGKNWEYRFFFDIDGNLDESKVNNAIYGIKSETEKFRILGNFEA